MDAQTLHALRLLIQTQMGFRDFKTMGLDGLWRESKEGLEILAVHSSYPGTGQFRSFIAEMKNHYSSISVWEIWNDDLFAALVRYGFKPASKLDQTGDVLAGLRWDRT